MPFSRCKFGSNAQTASSLLIPCENRPCLSWLFDGDYSFRERFGTFPAIGDRSDGEFKQESFINLEEDGFSMGSPILVHLCSSFWGFWWYSTS